MWSAERESKKETGGGAKKLARQGSLYVEREGGNASLAVHCPASMIASSLLSAAVSLPKISLGRAL